MADGGVEKNFPDEALERGRQRRQGLHIAVIGSGAAGLSAAWLLSQRHHVTIFERDLRPGGHAHTVDAREGERMTPIDTGFIVYNEATYPNFTAWMETLGAPTKTSDMSFAVSLQRGAAEYSSVDMHAMLNGGANLLRPSFWAMLYDLWRFYRRAPAESPVADDLNMSLGEFLDRYGYGRSFQDQHLLPQAAAIWSATLEDIRAYPACAFIRFFDNHGLLKFKGRPQWRTVDGGSRAYVQRALMPIAEKRFGAGVAHIARSQEGVCVTAADGARALYDHVVIAAHANDALRLLSDASADERRLLGAFRHSLNHAVLHSDAGLMPRNKRLWASWNYVGADETATPCGVTYWMNRLQTLDTPRDYFLSLNPARAIDESAIVWRGDYEHPIFDSAALHAQRDLWTLQGVNRTWFCGAHFGAGFHEDAVQAGFAVAEQLGGVRRPWEVAEESARIYLGQPPIEAAEAA